MYFIGSFGMINFYHWFLPGIAGTLRPLTDALPLVSALSRVSPPRSAHQQRQLAYILKFTCDLRHTPGAANVVADSLSRPTSSKCRLRRHSLHLSAS